MAVTVVERRHARPGQGAALVVAMDALGKAVDARERATVARLFRGFLDQDLVVSVADWPDRQAYATRLAWAVGDGGLAALCREPAELAFFRLHRTYGVMGRPSRNALCWLIRVPRGAGEALRALWSEGAGLLRGAEGFAHWYTFTDEDDPDHFMVVSEWESWAAAHAYLTGPAFELLPGLIAAEAVMEPVVSVPLDTT
jgi:quinol monooxygenase YgiN